MKLPNAHLALVEREKVTDYLLNPAHRYGASKARFFVGFGFRLEAWEALAVALREHGQKHDITKVKETGFGPRYEIDGELVAPDWPSPFGKWTKGRLRRGSSRPILWTRYD